MTITALQAKSQLIVNIQLPPNGVTQKSQLWNMTITNTGSASLLLHVDLTFTEVTNSMQVMSAATQVITILPGTTQLTNALLQPVQYNVLSPLYAVDISPNGLLPIGNFEVCYSFMNHNIETVEKIAEDCRELIIEPLSPPLLIYPYDQSVIETENPQLSWLSPMPVNLFSNLKYNLDLVEVFPNQSPSDAIQQNFPLFQQTGITVTNLLYPNSAPILELNKQYAWRITATSNESAVTKSETWVFSRKEFFKVENIKSSELPFAKLKKDDRGGYAIFVNELKFDYLNENADSIWNIKVYDLSKPDKKQISLMTDGIILKPGLNLIKYDVTNNPEFLDRHLYLLEIINTRKESWKLRFEYRKPQE